MNIGLPEDFTLRKQFSDQTPPVFVDNRPYFEVGDSMVNMYLMLDRPGTIYYVVAPYGTMTTTGKDNDGNTYNFSTDLVDYEELPTRGENDSGTGEMVYDYEITAPSALSIINASNQSNSRIKYGSIQGGSTEVEELVEDLEIKSDYIVYFVIQGNSSQVYSPVYAYRFSTEDVTPAYITMRTVNPAVEFTTSEDARLYYALYASNRLPSLFTTQTLGDNLAPEYDGVLTDPDILDMTILEAISTTYDGVTGESYFDRYASDEIKEQARLAITSQTSSEALDKGNIPDMLQRQPQSHDFTNAMDPDSGTTYLCLATAQNRLGGDWTFKGANGVRIPDEEAPVLVKVTTTPTKIDGGANPVRVSGTVLLQFSETIYHINEEGDPESLRSIVQTPNSTTSRVGFLDLVTQSNSNLQYSDNSGTVTNTITLNFYDAPVGATFSFCNTGHLADASANSRTEDTYTLQLQPTAGIGNIDNGTSYEFVVIQGNYAGS